MEIDNCIEKKITERHQAKLHHSNLAKTIFYLVF